MKVNKCDTQALVGIKMKQIKGYPFRLLSRWFRQVSGEKRTNSNK